MTAMVGMPSRQLADSWQTAGRQLAVLGPCAAAPPSVQGSAFGWLFGFLSPNQTKQKIPYQAEHPTD